MNMLPALEGCRHLGEHAAVIRRLGSPLVAAVLEAAQRHLHVAPATEHLIADWPGDRAAAALAMRLQGALHLIARSGGAPDLAAIYRGERAVCERAVADVLAAHDSFIAGQMRHATQTNEVARCAALLGALMVVAERFGLPLELLELGASCGLNLNLLRYRYRLANRAAGSEQSLVDISPEWRGPAPPDASPIVTFARGVDLNPIDPFDHAACERLHAYVWPDQPCRAARLDAALEVARRHPPAEDMADGIGWLRRRLGEPQAAGTCRVVVHSMFRQYLCPTDQERLARTMAAHGAASTPDRPLALIALEWSADRRAVQLELTCWPQGAARILATCHPYGDWIDWLPG